jgi:hypothetical protein
VNLPLGLYSMCAARSPTAKAAALPVVGAAPTPAASPQPNANWQDHVSQFNGNINLLITDLVRAYPHDATAARVKKRVALSINLTPMYVIDTVGPYLVKYTDEINARKYAFFIENSYDSELKAAVDEQKANETVALMPLIKQAFKQFSDAKKASYAKLVESMLLDYVEYRLKQAGE